jgi:hypothetical protein
VSLAGTARAQSSPASTSRDLVNAARIAAGVGALSDDPRLDAIAQAQAQRMAARNAIYHNPNLKSDATAAGVNWQVIGENVGVGPDVGSIHQGFMASPPHHENIVYPDYDVIGVGVATGNDGSVFVAQEFAGLAPAAPPARTSPPAAPAAHAPAAAAPAPTYRTVHAALAPRPSAPVIHRGTQVEAAVAVRHPEANAVVGGVVDEEVRL